MNGSQVALTRCQSYRQPDISQALARQFDLLGGLSKFIRAGDKVLIKPNFIAPRSHHEAAAQTHPAVVLELARLLKDFGAKPFVGDSPAWSNVYACARALELEEPLRRLSVPIRQLDKPKGCLIGRKKLRIGISSVALDADAIINLPKFKSHQQLVTTFAVKNMFGCVSGKQKALWHFRKGGNTGAFCEMLIDIYAFLGPVVTIIDAVVVMEGPGPIRGKSKHLGWLIGGTEPIACETICCKLIDIKPEIVPIITTAQHIGFGCADINKIEILGDDFSQNIYRDFKLPKLTPLRFSFVHVCKSIGKQILLLAGFTDDKRRHADGQVKK